MKALFKPDDFRGLMADRCDEQALLVVCAARANGILNAHHAEMKRKILDAVMIGPVNELEKRLDELFE